MKSQLAAERSLIVRTARWGCRALAAVCVSFVLVVLTLRVTPVGTAIAERFMESTQLAELPAADAIVILGGDPLRAADALRVYRAGIAPIIIVSGDPEESLPILDAGRIPRSVVRFDTAANRTMDHPRTIQDIEGISTSSRLILISSKLHQRRALSIFQHAGYDHVWVCSLEWERYQQLERGRVSHIAVACILYEMAARAKSWLVD